MNSTYWIIAPTVAAMLIVVAVALKWRNDIAQKEAQVVKMAKECNDARLERDAYRAKSDFLVYDNEALKETILTLDGRNADMLDNLQAAQAEIKSLNMATKEMPQMETQAPIPTRPTPKRTTKKAGSE